MRSLLILILATSTVFSASAEQAVLDALEVYRNGMLRKDGKSLDKVLSDDLTYTHSGGEFETKADVIRSVTSGKTVTEKLDFTETTVRIYGNTALVTGRVDLQHSPTNVVHMNVLHVFVSGPHGWQIVARQATRLAK
jgi:hypothetical protein